ncbi:cysteine dioxygenase type 1 [Biomphalaria glabrata]|nr:cysteine dioxygenase type 1 [Biomphalaria glabrata]
MSLSRMQMNEREANSGIEDILTLTELKFLLTLVNYEDQNEAEKKYRSLLRRYKGGAPDLDKHFTDSYDCYNRKLLLQEEKFTLLMLIFPPRKGNKVHDHGSSSCVFKVLKGKLFERQYHKPRGEQKTLVRKGQITYRSKDGDLNVSSATNTLHSVRNLSRRKTAVSLVLYYPPLTECHIYDNSGNAFVRQPMFGKAVPTVHDLHRLDGENDDDAEEVEDHEM